MHDKPPAQRHHSGEPENGNDPTEVEPRPSPKIYIASLADYNNGFLHGEWMDAAREPEAIEADIHAMLARSRQPDAEEWAIHDYEGFGTCQIHELDGIDHVSRIARGIVEHGLAFGAWAQVHEDNPDRYDDFSQAYLGHYESLQAYAEQFADDVGYAEQLAALPESMQQYVRVDTAAMARDMEASDQLYVFPDPNGGVWLFDAEA